MTAITTTVISFRVHKNIKSWLEYAGKGFESEGELLRLIVTKAAIEQASDTGISGFLKDLLAKREHSKVGNTIVLGVRLPVLMSQLVKECATKRGKTTSEWCSLVLLDWWQYFSGLYERYKGQSDTWLSQHATEYRAYVAETSTVYAQKSGKALA